ncbi:MAG: GNAT family N-acetyltransferase [Chloroflexota bacterium]|nr:GNAT family N-acetyltransferase [Chloroflexota bacterium]
MQIRLAVPSDLQAAARLWHDRMALLQQTDTCIKLLPDAAARWRIEAERWIASDVVGFYVAEAEGDLAGFAAVQVVPGRPGLRPARLGVILDMAVDLHSARSGLSEQLLGKVRRWLASKDIHHLEIDVPARYPVEEAFWRARRASVRFNRYWLEI